MTESSSTTPADTAAVTRTSKRKAVRAVLAGGLVLGVGAAVTLAAWNDSEFVQGIFSAGSFNLQGSLTAGGTFTDHNSAGGAASLAFSIPVTNLAPGNTVYAPYFVQLAAGTTTGANLTVAGLTATDSVSGAANAANLSYTVVPIAVGATCNAASVSGGTSISSSNSLNTLGTPAGTVALTKGATATVAGATQQLCFAITASNNLVQGGVTTATWQLTAVSQ
ncbi:SipW-dependent-type signal peptide-containing protein [Mycetocola sp. JXN-3]|uniref:SipW-dependent-type signal peptide-containing protein n=1 Tax=Mycetocola sp. JXN-3 TaxID=2116510 RepID=UPI00165D2CAB|nr:SipW-dependent-type signal peptide-containing protein [Mycetocola sp. JXN-3]